MWMGWEEEKKGIKELWDTQKKWERDSSSPNERWLSRPRKALSATSNVFKKNCSLYPSLLHPSLHPHVDGLRLPRNDRAQWLTHTHWGDNSMGDIWAFCLRPAAWFVPLSEYTPAQAHISTGTRTSRTHWKKAQPGRGDVGQLSVKKQTHWSVTLFNRTANGTRSRDVQRDVWRSGHFVGCFKR